MNFKNPSPRWFIFLCLFSIYLCIQNQFLDYIYLSIHKFIRITISVLLKKDWSCRLITNFLNKIWWLLFYILIIIWDIFLWKLNNSNDIGWNTRSRYFCISFETTYTYHSSRSSINISSITSWLLSRFRSDWRKTLGDLLSIYNLFIKTINFAIHFLHGESILRNYSL